jgi:hypothetical protein
LISAIITDAGIVYPPFRFTLPDFLRRVKAERGQALAKSSQTAQTA